MSLLDDVSIVVTPNGYKAGELYAVIPVPTEGSELVVNGDFATDTDWTKGTGWTISGGSASQSGGTGQLYQTISTTVGVYCKITFTVNVTSGAIRIAAGPSATIADFTTSGTYTLIVPFLGNTVLYILGSSASFVGSVSNVSVKEYTSADMDVTRETAATRVDENGLVNYAEVLGGEEVTNGDFATDSDWNKTQATISGGEVRIITTDGSYAAIDQSNVFVVGKTYLYSIDVKSISGTMQLRGGSGTDIDITTSGVKTGYIVPTSTTLEIKRKSGAGALDVTIDNVSVKEVTRDNVPRIDYTGGGCPHILAEPQRTNLVTYSESFGSGKYFDTYTGANEVSSNNTSPSGTENATQIISTGQGKLYAFISLPANTTYSFSFYAKNVDATEVKSRILATGGSGGSNLTPVSYISQLSTTEWTKITHIFTTNSTAVQYYVFISHALSIGGNIQIWGAQLELGSFPTSLIPTSGSTVTRNQDQFTRDGIGSLINSTEGVLFLEIAALADDNSDRRITLTDGTLNNAVNIGFSRFTGNINGEIHSSGTQQTTGFGATGVTQTNNNKFAIRWGNSNYSFFTNGLKTNDLIIANSPTGLNVLKFSSGNNIFKMFAKVKQLQVYKTALTDEQLIQLTGESGTDFYESYAEMAAALNYTIQ